MNPLFSTGTPVYDLLFFPITVTLSAFRKWWCRCLNPIHTRLNGRGGRKYFCILSCLTSDYLQLFLFDVTQEFLVYDLRSTILKFKTSIVSVNSSQNQSYYWGHMTLDNKIPIASFIADMLFVLGRTLLHRMCWIFLCSAKIFRHFCWKTHTHLCNTSVFLIGSPFRPWNENCTTSRRTHHPAQPEKL